MRAFVGAVGEACPAASALEMEPFHKREFHRLHGIPINETCVMREGVALAIAKGVGISEMEAF